MREKYYFRQKLREFYHQQFCSMRNIKVDAEPEEFDENFHAKWKYISPFIPRDEEEP